MKFFFIFILFILASCSLEKPFKKKAFSISNPPIELIDYQISIKNIKNLDSKISKVYLPILSQALDTAGISNYIIDESNTTKLLELNCYASLKQNFLIFSWKLIDKQSLIKTSFITKEPITIFQTLDPLTLKISATRVAQKIKRDIYFSPNPSIIISKLEGFPGGKNTILSKSLKEELTKLSIDVYINNPKPINSELSLVGILNRKQIKDDTEKIIITWFLNGKKTGFIQENTIPINMLEKAWIKINKKIAENAAPLLAKEIKTWFSNIARIQ